MAGYSLRIKDSAAKELDRVEPKSVRRAVVARIRARASDPRPPGCEKLSGERQHYRVRQGTWRVVYEIRDTDHVVVIVKVGHRRDVYKRM